MWPFNLFKRKHKCNFHKPIASAYVSFNTRDSLYECKCGKRNIERESVRFDVPFPAPTGTLLTRRDLEKMMLNSEVFPK